VTVSVRPGAAVDGPLRVTTARFSTRDPDLGDAYLSETFRCASERISLEDGYRLRAARTALGAVSVGRLQLVAHERRRLAPGEAVSVAHLLGGRYRVAAGGAELDVRPGEVVLDPGGGCQLEWEDVELDAVVLPTRLVADTALESVDLDPRRFRFTGQRPVSRAALEHWVAALRYVETYVLANPAARRSELVLGATLRLLASAALVVFPSTASGASPQLPEPATPIVARRAAAFIEEHAARPITLSEIAATARVTPRALQYAFRRTFDTTPTGYHRRVRLERAHRELQLAAPEDGETVTTIAARWGFANPGRFAALYRRTYGTSPSTTLRG